MYYLKSATLFGLILLLCSCSSEEKEEQQSIDKTLAQKEIPEHKSPPDSPFLIPSDNEFYKLKNLEDFLAFYPSIDEKYADEKYINNLRHRTIHALFYNGLLEEDPEVVRYYVKELAALHQALPNIDNFEKAITTLENYGVEKEELKPEVLAFCSNNIEFLANIEDVDQRPGHKKRLALLDKLQSRYN